MKTQICGISLLRLSLTVKKNPHTIQFPNQPEFYPWSFNLKLRLIDSSFAGTRAKRAD